jgi:hypothetical protein
MENIILEPLQFKDLNENVALVQKNQKRGLMGFDRFIGKFTFFEDNIVERTYNPAAKSYT